MPHWWLYFTLVALVTALAGLLVFWLIVLRQSSRPRVLCLMYHRLAERKEYDRITGSERVYTIATDVFEAQIAYLKNAGFSFVTADELRRFVTGELPLHDPSVMITFDDGCRSVVRLAPPILARYEAVATVFVTTDPTSPVFGEGAGKDPRASDDELRAADGSTLCFESHAASHRPLRGMSEEQLRGELGGSKAELERVLARPVRYLAIPGNWFDRRVMKVAREVGYQAVWCSNPGVTRVGANLYGLPRVGISGCLPLSRFPCLLDPHGIARRVTISWIRRLPARLLGPRWWLPLRDRLVRRIPGQYVSNRALLMLVGIAITSIICALYWLSFG